MTTTMLAAPTLTACSNHQMESLNDKRSQFRHHITHLNGIKYHYVDSGPSETPQTLVIFIHGFPEVWYTWKDQMELFSDTSKYRVIALDMPGYGETDIPEELERYTYQSVSTDLIELIKNQLGYSRTILIGHNWGSYVAFHMARIQPDLVTAVVSLSSGYYPTPILPELRVKAIPQLGYQLNLAKPGNCQKFNKNIDEFLAAFWTYKYSSPLKSCLAVSPDDDFIQYVRNIDKQVQDFPEPEVKSYITDQFRHTGTCGATNWYRTADLNYDIAVRLNPNRTELDLPVLLMAGEDDFAAPAIGAGTNFLPHHTIKLIPNAGHFLHLSHSLAVFTTIHHWLRNLTLTI